MAKHFETQALFPGSELELIRCFMGDEGIDGKRWLFGTGLELSTKVTIDSTISMRQFDMVYRNVYRLAQRPGLGIDFGLALNLSRWGMLSSALLCANTLGHALALANEFREILRSRFSMENRVHSDGLIVDLVPKPDLPFPVNSLFAHEVLLGTLKTQIEQLTAKPFLFSQIALPYPAPRDASHYAKLAENKIKFDAPQGQVVIPLKLMQQPLPMKNRTTRKLVLANCREELERVRKARVGDIVFLVNSILSQAEHHLPDLSEVASQLSMSPRTLRRKLQSEQINFRSLCEQHRQQRAVNLLANLDMPIRQVAERCGFVDTVSFHKAFKRWTGETPSQYRSQL